MNAAQDADEFWLYDLRVETVVGDRTSVCRHVEGESFRVEGELLIFDEQQKVNVSPRIFRYTEQELAEFRSSVEGRYQFVRERFGFNLDIWDQAVAKLRVTGDA